MAFTFAIGPVSRNDLTDQLARALDLRTELRSRQAVPRMWKATDKLREHTTEDATRRRAIKNKVFGIMFLVLGLILAIPAFAMGGLSGATIGGVIAMIVGVTYLSPKSKNPPRKCIQMAEKLLAMRATVPSAVIKFDETGMTVGTQDPIAYDKLEGILETQDLYLLIINNSAMFFLKSEQTEGTAEEFSKFLAAQSAMPFQCIA